MGFAALNPSCASMPAPRPIGAPRRTPGRDRVRCRRRDGVRARCCRCAARVFASYDVKQRSFFVAGALLRPGSLPFLLSLSFRSPDRGGGGAPGGGIHYSVAPVIARRHVCEAWAVPRNRDDASRRSTVTVLGPVPALRLRSCLRVRRAGDPRCRVLASGRPRVPNLPGTVYEPRPGRHLPLRLRDRLRRRPSMSGILACYDTRDT